MLLCCTFVALAFANSPLAEKFSAFWETRLIFGAGAFKLDYSLHHWINDGFAFHESGIHTTIAGVISGLSLDGVNLNAAKVGVLSASFLSAAAGMLLLAVLLPKKLDRS